MARKTNYFNLVVAERTAALIKELGMTTKDIIKYQPCERKNAYLIRDGLATPSYSLIREIYKRKGECLEYILFGEE